MENQKESVPVQVFAGDFQQAHVIKNMLEHHGIPVFIENEMMSSIAPFQVTAGGLSPVKVVVSSSDRDEAVRLIEDFNGRPTAM